MLCFCASDSHINHLKEPYAVSIRRVLLFFFICLVYIYIYIHGEGG